MTERIQGPSGPPESSRPGGRSSRKIDSDKFKEEMRRVDEVSKIDPDEAKKRKRPEETVREEEAARASPKEGSKQEPPKPGSFKAPATSTSAAEGKDLTPSEKAASAEETPTEEESKAPLKRETTEEKPSFPTEQKEGEKSFLSEVKQRSESTGRLRTRIAEVEEGLTIPASSGGEEEKKEGAAAASRNLAISESQEKSEEPKEVEEPTEEEELSLPEEPPPPYTHLHPDLLDLFERSIGAMIYMDDGGIKETVIHIASSEENPSVFNGSRITIREYSTAPKEFNVELAGPPKAVDLFQDNVQDLKVAFNSASTNFKVNSIQTSYQ